MAVYMPFFRDIHYEHPVTQGIPYSSSYMCVVCQFQWAIVDTHNIHTYTPIEFL